jgi:UDP:flavonoid glycosyltransferase YjiC (YdhE family)
MKTDRPKVLLVAEAVTLAHYGRIMTLAKWLDPNLYDVVVASDPRYRRLDAAAEIAFRPIRSIASKQFSRALAAGKPLYDAATLTQYAEQDLEVLDELRPDLVVGDFRLSLAVSAPLRKVPYAAVVNAYWSPHARIRYPVPDLPFTKILGLKASQILFDAVRPLAFALHARPLNNVRRRFGLAELGSDLRAAYSWGDYTLYADSPGIIAMHPLPPAHRFLGPVPWSATVNLPSWWPDVPKDHPLIVVTLGSSGRSELLPEILSALKSLPVTVIVASAGGSLPDPLPGNAFAAEFLPMEAVLQHARVLICNGGSLTTYQAMTLGVPVLGICSNMDQLLNMQNVERIGAGTFLRAAKVRGSQVHEAISRLLSAPGDRRFSGAREWLDPRETCTRFLGFVRSALQTPV